MEAGVVVLMRRILIAIMAGLLVALAIRVRGRGGVPPQIGGWRKLKDDELRDWPAG